MKIELRKVHYSASLSEETNAYSADLYIDGVLTAHVSNHGQGGCDEVHPANGKTYDDITSVEQWIKANHPPRTTDIKMPDGSMFVMDVTLESLCGDIVAEYLSTKELQRLLKRTVAYFDPTKKSVYTFKGKLEGVQRAHTITALLRSTPHAVVLNNLPFDEALKVFRSTAAA